MDTLKKALHPTSKTPHESSSSSPSTAAEGNHPNQPTQAPHAETVTEEQQQQQQPRKIPRAGHHHPRQPVGATGLPPNHRPREDFTGPGADATGGGVDTTGAGAGRRQVEGEGEGEGDVDWSAIRKVAAESGNNFPGTNPDPAHSALGNQSLTGQKGSVLPGRE